MSIQILSKENTLILFFRQRLRKKIRVVDKKEFNYRFTLSIKERHINALYRAPYIASLHDYFKDTSLTQRAENPSERFPACAICI